MTEMVCQELVELITEYLEDSLSAEDRVRFEEHLDACGKCRDYIEQFRTTVALTGKLSEQSLSGAIRDELLAAFRTWRVDRQGA